MLDSPDGLVRIFEWERDDTWTEIELVSDGEEVARILSGHVSNAADLALAPKMLVIVEGWHLIEVNGVDRDHSTFAQG